jgi:hypothetical protein
MAVDKPADEGTSRAASASKWEEKVNRSTGVSSTCPHSYIIRRPTGRAARDITVGLTGRKYMSLSMGPSCQSDQRFLDGWGSQV